MAKESVENDVPSIMRAASQHMSKLANQNVGLVKRAESAERELLIVKIARRMEQRGLQQHLSYEEKVAHLSEVQDLDAVQAAVEIAAGGVSLGKVAEADRPSNNTRSDSAEDLEAFINSQSAFS
jgi:hypothetical protein